LLGQVTDHALGIRAFRHFLNKGGLDLVTVLGLNSLATQVMRKSPAGIAAAAGAGGASFLPQPTSATDKVPTAASASNDRLENNFIISPS